MVSGSTAVVNRGARRDGDAGRAPWPEAMLALALFAVLSAAFTYPLVLHLADAVEDGQDALLNVWILAWDGHALLTNPLGFFDANIFVPFQRSLAFSEINLSQALLALPVTVVSANPVLGYNVALCLTFVLSGWGMYLLARQVTGNAWGGIAAGVVFTFNAYKLSNLAQIQLLSLHWLPFALLFLDRILRRAQAHRGGWRAALPDVLATAVFLTLQALASFYYAIFAGLAVGLFVLCRWAGEPHTLNRTTVLSLAVAGCLAVLAVLPFAIPYFQVQQELGFQRSLAESEPFSASLSQYTQALPNNLLYGRWLAPRQPVVIGGYALDALFPGLFTTLMALAGAVLAIRAWRRGLFHLVLVPFSFALSLGPVLHLTAETKLDLPFALPYAWLYALVPGFQALRAPARFSILLFLGLSLLAAWAVAALSRLSHGRVLALSALVLLGLECLTVPAAQVYPVPVGEAVPPVYRWLAKQSPTTILELPLGGRDARQTLLYQYFSTYHWQRTPDGYSGFIPPQHGEMVYEMSSFPSQRSLALLHGYGVEYLVIHRDRLPAPLPPLPDDLQLIQTFGGDQVYRLLSRHGSADTSLQVYLPALATPSQPYTAYLIIQTRGSVPLVVLPTHRPVVQATWAAPGGVQQLTVQATVPIVTSQASVVAVPLGPAPSNPVSLTLHVDDPVLGQAEATGTVAPTQQPRGQPFPVPARLEFAATDKPEYAAGESVRLSVRWHALGKIDAYYSAFAALLGPDGQTIVRRDGEPQQGKRPTLLWAPGEEIPDEYALALPPDVPPGAYAVEVGLYRASDMATAMTLGADGLPLPRLVVGRVKVPLPQSQVQPQHALDSVLDGKIALVGYDLMQAGGNLTVTLYWRALERIPNDYTVFLQALAPDGGLAGQCDNQPLGGHYPTGIWSPGEVVADPYHLILSPGEYRLIAGMYDLGTMTRLRTTSDDKVELTTLRVTP